MRVTGFEWDDENLLHIGRHQVTPSEVEEACWSNRLVLKARFGRYAVLGQTEVGRYLFVVVRKLERGRVKVVTAREMTETERRLYWRIKG